MITQNATGHQNSYSTFFENLLACHTQKYIKQSFIMGTKDNFFKI